MLIDVSFPAETTKSFAIALSGNISYNKSQLPPALRNELWLLAIFNTHKIILFVSSDPVSKAWTEWLDGLEFFTNVSFEAAHTDEDAAWVDTDVGDNFVEDCALMDDNCEDKYLFCVHFCWKKLSCLWQCQIDFLSSITLKKTQCAMS